MLDLIKFQMGLFTSLNAHLNSVSRLCLTFIRHYSVENEAGVGFVISLSNGIKLVGS